MSLLSILQPKKVACWCTHKIPTNIICRTCSLVNLKNKTNMTSRSYLNCSVFFLCTLLCFDVGSLIFKEWFVWRIIALSEDFEFVYYVLDYIRQATCKSLLLISALTGGQNSPLILWCDSWGLVLQSKIEICTPLVTLAQFSTMEAEISEKSPTWEGSIPWKGYEHFF